MDEIGIARQSARVLWDEWRDQQHRPATPLYVPVEQIAASLGVDIAKFAPEDFPQTLGYLDPEDDLIWLCEGLSPAVARFTLAHELGHWRLHRGEPDTDGCASAAISNAIDTADHAAILRPNEAYSPRSRRERQANAFAAELLAPLPVVRAAYLGDATHAPRTPLAIAAACGVSTAVIVAQMTRLLQEGDSGVGATSDDGSVSHTSPVAATAASVAATVDAPTVIALDAAQQAAVTTAMPALIVAGPGTGKTSTLVGRVRWLVAQGTDPGAILALTFSRKAAQEMRERITAALGATTTLPTVTTFHRFGADLLRSYGHLVGLRPDFRLVDEIGAFFLLRDSGHTLPLNHYAALANPTQHFGALLSAIGTAKDELVTPARYAELAQAQLASATTEEEREAAERALEVAAVYAAYQEALERRQDPDYGDLIRLAVALLAQHPTVLATVQQQYTCVLVDEFQDINRANGVLLRYLAGSAGNIWAVGDANQAIYRFRGASPANIANFAVEYPGASVVALDQNYRSRPAIVVTANRFAAATLDHGDATPLVALHARRADEPGTVVMRVAPDAAGEIAAIVVAIAGRNATGTPYHEQAVLCRTRALARQVTRALSAAAIPAEMTTDLFDDDAIKDMLGVAHLLAGEMGGLLRAARVADHALDRQVVSMIVATARSEGQTMWTAIDATLAPGQLTAANHQALLKLREVLRTLHHTASMAQALTAYLFELTGQARQHLRTGDATALHLAELLALASRYDEERPAIAGTEADIAALQRWRNFMAYLRDMRALPRLSVAREERDDASRDSVHVLTIHGAKGLEWPVVYLPGLVTSRFPTAARWDPTPPPPGLIAGAVADPKEAHLLEEACLFYVALTRARDTLVLSRAERYSAGRRSSPSPFLSAILQDQGVTVEQTPAASAGDERGDDDALLPPAPDPVFPADATLPAAAIATYDRCPRQYAYRYGYRFSGRRGSYWRLRHAVATTLRDAIQPDISEADALHLFDTTWHDDGQTSGEGSDDDPFAAIYQQRGRAAVATALRHLRGATQDQPSRATFAQTVAIVVDETLVSVEIDRVETSERRGAQPDTVRRHPPERRAVRHQLERRKTAGDPDVRFYLTLLAQRQLGADDATDTVVEHQLAGDALVPVTLKPQKEAQLRQRVRAAITGIKMGDFPAHPEPRQCAACEFALICPV